MKTLLSRSRVISLDHQYVLNYCTKYLVRSSLVGRHAYTEQSTEHSWSSFCEAWRFPIVDTYCSVPAEENDCLFNRVTFVFRADSPDIKEVSVIGTFCNLYEPINLSKVKFLERESSQFWAVTIVVPKHQVHRYRFLVDGAPVLDSVNPQRTILDNGVEWSRFFTWQCTIPLTFEDWEMSILVRLTDHILPFRTAEGEMFLKRFYESLDKQSKQNYLTNVYRLDQPVGAANYIDKIISREEAHRLIDYQICLSQIRNVLELRNPGQSFAQISKEAYLDLYEEMATDQVDGWNTLLYASPRNFLKLLRRHTYTGAFSHPKYGGNTAAIGWAYLNERYLDDKSKSTLFDWRRSLERPFGECDDYLG